MSTTNRLSDELLSSVSQWYEEQRSAEGQVNANVMCAGLYASKHVADRFPLAEEDYLTSSQVRGAGGPAVQRILAEHGENRKFVAEGGRTSRQTRALTTELVELLSKHPLADDLAALPAEDRSRVAFRIQAWFVERVGVDYFGRQRLSANVDASLPVRVAVHSILVTARERPGTVAGAVAQHLVGAKLSLRFPELTVANESYTAADQQTDRPGDFLVGDSAFHVTVAPGEQLFANRCMQNLSDGFRPIALVPEDKIEAAKQLADLARLTDKVLIQSLEDFVGTNIEEIGGFSGQHVRTSLKLLLETYNERVRAVEPDPSLQIELPTNL